MARATKHRQSILGKVNDIGVSILLNRDAALTGVWVDGGKWIETGYNLAAPNPLDEAGRRGSLYSKFIIGIMGPGSIGAYRLTAWRWPRDASVEMKPGRWGAARVLPRNEKALARDCEQLGVSYFLPLYEKRTRRRDTGKLRKSVLPLFSGYFLFYDDGDARLKLLQTNRIINMVEIVDQERFALELSQIQEAVERSVPFRKIDAYQPGQLVRILSGPMQGLVGVIEEKRSGRRLMLTFEALNAAIVIDLDVEEIEAV